MSCYTLTIIINNIEETINLGHCLGVNLKQGDVILLNGDLGVGKTTLAKSIAHALGVKSYITSPTFTILKTYEISNILELAHFDFYRLSSNNYPYEFYDYIGNDGYISLIEWPFNIQNLIPEDYLLINISWLSENRRKMELIGTNQKYKDLIKKCIH